DSTGPEIVSLSVSQATVSPGDTFTITAHVTDPAGVDTAGFWFTVDGVQNDFCGQQLTLTSGTRTDGTWTNTCTVPSMTRLGSYTITPYARDTLNNYTNTNGGRTDSTRAHFELVE
ncbi:MAG TPA: Ig-like domain-containing protein, partial [Nocardioidaceae bacterium]|nr:Ig-like domain-containing protein [Nocardioidaceae bacterium]